MPPFFVARCFITSSLVYTISLFGSKGNGTFNGVNSLYPNVLLPSPLFPSTVIMQSNLFATIFSIQSLKSFIVHIRSVMSYPPWINSCFIFSMSISSELGNIKLFMFNGMGIASFICLSEVKQVLKCFSCISIVVVLFLWSVTVFDIAGNTFINSSIFVDSLSNFFDESSFVQANLLFSIISLSVSISLWIASILSSVFMWLYSLSCIVPSMLSDPYIAILTSLSVSTNGFRIFSCVYPCATFHASEDFVISLFFSMFTPFFLFVEQQVYIFCLFVLWLQWLQVFF